MNSGFGLESLSSTAPQGRSHFMRGLFGHFLFFADGCLFLAAGATVSFPGKTKITRVFFGKRGRSYRRLFLRGIREDIAEHIDKMLIEPEGQEDVHADEDGVQASPQQTFIAKYGSA